MTLAKRLLEKLWQEQMDNDPKVKEIQLRFDVLKALANQDEISQSANQEIAGQIYETLKEDAYFSDASIGLVAEKIQTLGYMKTVRANFDLLGTADKEP